MHRKQEGDTGTGDRPVIVLWNDNEVEKTKQIPMFEAFLDFSCFNEHKRFGTGRDNIPNEFLLFSVSDQIIDRHTASAKLLS